MDVTEQSVTRHGGNAAALVLGKACSTSRSTADFDDQKRAYAPDLLPAAGRPAARRGPDSVPAGMPHDGPDNIACDGQAVSLPSPPAGSTLYMLGAGAPGSQGGR